MQSLRFHRRIALIAVAALLFASTAYLVHGFGDSASPHSKVHCDLCLQFNGTAGAPDASGLTGTPPQVAHVSLAPDTLILPARRKVGSQLPRAPPARFMI